MTSNVAGCEGVLEGDTGSGSDGTVGLLIR